jgi:hypothetical protein
MADLSPFVTTTDPLDGRRQALAAHDDALPLRLARYAKGIWVYQDPV